MTTLLEIRDGSGKLVGRCDARCYNAKHDDCTCICHGKNHGIGLDVAIEQTRLEYKEWTTNFDSEHDVVLLPVQLNLFT